MSKFFSNSKSPRKFEYITSINNYPLQMQGKLQPKITSQQQQPKRQNALEMWNIGNDESFNDSNYIRNKIQIKHANNPNKSVDSYRIILPDRNVIFVQSSCI